MRFVIKKTDGDDVLVNSIEDFGEIQIVFVSSKIKIIKVCHSLMAMNPKSPFVMKLKGYFWIQIGLQNLEPILVQSLWLIKLFP